MVAYWIITILVVQENVAGSIWGALHLEFITANLQHLGYPAYFQNFLGFWQLLGALAILSPRLGRAKEWAYAGVFFNYSSAVASHMMVGDGPDKWAAPLVYAIIAVASWALRPPDRRVVAVAAGRTSPRTWIIHVGVLGLLVVISLLTLPKGTSW